MKFQPTKEGYYGQFGGAFIPELLYPNVKELEDNYLEILVQKLFKKNIKICCNIMLVDQVRCI